MDARIGIDLGGTKIRGVVLEPDSGISRDIRRSTPRDSYGETLAAIVELALELDDSRQLSVGVGTPGTWLPGQGRMQNCNSTWLNGRPLKSDLEDRLGRRVQLANDADCFALSESLVGGSAAGRGVVFGVILGTGVGGGLVVDGQLISGPNGLTGEWGHTPISYIPDGLASRACYCGKENCVETYLSGPALLRTHLELWPGESDPSEDAKALYALADLQSAPGWQLHDPSIETPVTRARSTLALYCRLLAASLAQLVNVIDPHAIVLGGGLSNMRDIYLPLRELMCEHVFGEVFETELLPPAWGDASGVRGAAWLSNPAEEKDIQ
jgi:fructokinase